MSNHSTASPVNEQISSQQHIKIYATTWCGDCRMAKRWFDAHGISYEYINIEEDVFLGEDLFRLRIPGEMVGGQPLTVSITLMAEAVYGRCVSAMKDRRVEAAKAYKAATTLIPGERAQFVGEILDHCVRIVAVTTLVIAE